MWMTLLLAVTLACSQDGPQPVATRPAASQPTTRPVATQPATAPAVAWADDFDSDEPVLRRWDLSGRIRAVPLPVEGLAIAGVGGRGLVINAEAGATLQRSPDLPAIDFRNAREVVFRVDPVSASARRPLLIELQFLTRERIVWRGRRVRLTSPGWQEIRIPLVQALPVGDAHIEWDEIVTFGLRVRKQAVFGLDGVQVIAGDRAAELTDEQLAALAFGGGDYESWSSNTTHCTVLSNADGLSREMLDEALGQLRRRIQDDFPRRSFAARRPRILIFADEVQYRAFWPKLGARLDRQIPAPTTDGYSAFGIASSFCPAQADGSRGVRPVLVHEAAHVLLASMLGLQGSNWITEGFATRYQIAHSGQDLGAVIRGGLAEAGRRLPLTDLLGSDRLEPGRYWQAYVLVEYMLTSDHRPRFNATLAEIRSRGSADISKLLLTTWGERPKPFEKRWLEWAAQRWKAP